jgi:16S rRNA (guanine966-N2)-methyltransferase
MSTLARVRIIAGEKKGHRIAAPKGATTRPTSDFVRETAFNLIGPVDGASVLDVFAGSGALGLEALSRGAARATFVDSDRDACRTINANLDKLKLHATVLCQDALRALSTERSTYDLVLADPPYDYRDLDRIAPHLKRVLARDGLLVYQTDARTQPEIDGLEIRTSRKYGSARLTLFEVEGVD